MEYDEELIEKIKENEIIYNKSKKGYKNAILKEKKWKEISEELNISVETAKKRWRTIKDRYFRTKKASASGNAAFDRKPYRFALQLSFLDKCKRLNEGTTGNYTSGDGEDSMQKYELPKISFDSSYNSAITENISTSRSKKRRLVDEAITNNTKRELLKLIQEVANEPRRNTKEEIFCDLLATQMIEAKLPPERFRAIQIKFLQVLDEEVQQLTQSSHYF